MSSTAANKLSEQIHSEAQRQRALETSRHEITKLAYELLQKRLDERHDANERSNLEECALAVNEHGSKASILVAEHEKEKRELKAVGFSMVIEFDAERNKLLHGSFANQKAGGRQHGLLPDSVQSKPARDDQAVELELRKVVEEHERDQKVLCDNCRTWTQCVQRTLCRNCGVSMGFCPTAEIFEARSQARKSIIDRQHAYHQLVDHDTAESKLDEEALQTELDNRDILQARFDLECSFQLQFAEHERRRRAVQQSQVEELKALDNERDSRLAAVQQTYARVEDELYEERQRVEEWWKHLCEEAEAGLRRINEDERQALSKINRRDVPATVKAQGEAPPVELVAASRAVLALLKAEGKIQLMGGGLDEEKGGTTARRTPDQDATVNSSRVTLPVAAKTFNADDPSGTLINDSPHAASAGPSIPLVQVQGVSPPATGSTHAPGLSMRSKTQHNLAVGVAPPPVQGHQSAQTTSLSKVGLGGFVLDRSGSSDSGGSDSDFVEI